MDTSAVRMADPRMPNMRHEQAEERPTAMPRHDGYTMSPTAAGSVG